MELKDILKGTDYRILQGTVDKDVKRIEVDSRKVGPDTAFVCLKGSKTDGHLYAGQAANNGAAAIILEDVPEEKIDSSITVVQLKDTRKALARLSSNFYNNPGAKLKLIGVTGTKGKTTTVGMIEKILKQSGKCTGTIGTLGVRYGNVSEKLSNTTPDSLKLNQILSEMLSDGVEYVVMEVSSQSFKERRTDGLTFDFGVLLNIDQDHIGENEHKDFVEYLECKLKLIDQSKEIVVNKDDKIWSFLTSEQKERALSFSLEDKTADYYATEIYYTRSRESLETRFAYGGKQRTHIVLQMPGRFNVYNGATCF